jgi:hypothetical protein
VTEEFVQLAKFSISRKKLRYECVSGLLKIKVFLFEVEPRVGEDLNHGFVEDLQVPSDTKCGKNGINSSKP